MNDEGIIEIFCLWHREFIPKITTELVGIFRTRAGAMNAAPSHMEWLFNEETKQRYRSESYYWIEQTALRP